MVTHALLAFSCPYVPVSLFPSGLRPSSFIQERLQDKDRGNLINYPLVVLTGVAGFVEELMSLAGGETLVPEMNGKAGELAQLRRKLLRLQGAWASVASELERVANHDTGNGVAACETGDGAQVVAAVAVDFKREDGLDGEAELVGDCDADALGADIEAEIAKWGGQDWIPRLPA